MRPGNGSKEFIVSNTNRWIVGMKRIRATSFPLFLSEASLLLMRKRLSADGREATLSALLPAERKQVTDTATLRPLKPMMASGVFLLTQPT